MTLIWGKSCRVCGNTANEGDYCERCYEQQFPVCEYCKKPIRDGEEEVDNCHKKPCYSDKTGRCCECGAITSRGSYCKRCYERKFPVCEYCVQPIHYGEEKIKNYHKKPCYSARTRRCCECHDTASQGSYCQTCYDSKYPPPLRVELSRRGVNLKYYSRQEPKQGMIDSAMYSLGQGIAHALTGGGHTLYLPSSDEEEEY